MERLIVIDGRVYQSTQHAFHGEKFIRLAIILDDQDRAAQLMDFGATFIKPSAYSNTLAKKMGRSLRLNEEELWRWSKIKPDVQTILHSLG